MRKVVLLEKLWKRLWGDAAEARLAALDQRLAAAQAALERADTRIAPLEAGARAADASLGDARLRLQALEERTAAGDARVEEVHAKNDRLGGRLLRVEAQAEALAERWKAADSRVLDLEQGLEPRVAAAESRHTALEGRLPHLEARTQSHEGRFGSGAEAVIAADERTGAVGARVSSLESRTSGLDVPRVEGGLRGLEARIAHLEQASLDLLREHAEVRVQAERLHRIAAATTIVEREPLLEVLVSVVLPTRNRAALLATAVASIQAQRHPAWELLVVDDGSSDGTREALERTQDPRIRRIPAESVGPAAARNRALAEARGAIVAYLDDDNVASPLWLHAVAWAFQRHPEKSILYGAQAVQEDGPGGGPLDRRLWIRFEPWDRERLERGNYVDLGAVAHRHPLPEARFDEGVTPLEDWDLLLRLTRSAPPLELPVVCGTYRSDAPGRMTATPESARSQERIRAKLEADRAR
jgi:hypothetical protein